MPVINGPNDTFYHLSLNKLVQGYSFFDPPGLMTLAPDRLSWLTPVDGSGNQTRYLDISALYAPATQAPLDESNPSLPLIFTYERLMQSPEVTAIHADRIVEDVRANELEKSDKPFIVVGCKSTPNVFAGVPEVVVEWVSRVTVVSVRRYETGGGSWVTFDNSFKAFRRALCGISGYKVFLNGVIQGEVTQTAFLDELKGEQRDGDVQAVQQGIVFEVTWQS